MPNHGATDLYTLGAGKLLSGDIAWDTDTFTVALIDTDDYVADLTSDEFLSDIPGAAIVATSANLTGQAVVSATAQADPARFPATTGDTCEAVVIYKDTGSPATSSLLVYIDRADTGFPITPTGRGITISWNGSIVFGLDIGDQIDIQIFTASGTWTRPNGNFVTADVVCIGGGGGGGAGEAPSGNTAEGGGGGSPGGYSAGTLPFALLGATEAVVVGTGGNGGGATVWASVGNNGTAGNPSSFSIMEALGGGGGQGGQSTAGGVPGRPGVGTAPVGTKYQGATGATNAVVATTPDRCGGGGGASQNTGNSAASAGGNDEDNVTGSGTVGSSVAPGTAGGAGGDYTPSPSYAFKRGGGGGGGGCNGAVGSFNGVNGRIGGAGGIPGGGGGGGGGGYQGTSGGGGVGARGVVTVVCRGEA